MIIEFSCVLMRRILISITIVFAHVQFQTSVYKALSTTQELTQTSNKTNWWSLDESLAECFENIIKI